MSCLMHSVLVLAAACHSCMLLDKPFAAFLTTRLRVTVCGPVCLRAVPLCSCVCCREKRICFQLFVRTAAECLQLYLDSCVPEQQ
jgi:hypothetical protein